MRILFFIENYVEGGADNFLSSLVEKLSLDKKNYFTLLLNKNAPLNFYEKLKDLDNIQFVTYNLITPNDIYNLYLSKNNKIYYLFYLIFSYPLFFFSIIYFFILNYRFKKFDIYVINNGGYPGGFFSRSFNIALNFNSFKSKVYHIVHSTPDNYNIFSLFVEKFVIDKLIKINTSFISICKLVQLELYRFRGIKSDFVIYNGVGDYLADKFLDKSLFTIVHIASINRNKNQILLVEAVYDLVHKFNYRNKFVIKFIGFNSDPFYYNQLLCLVNKLDLVEYFQFIGSTSDIKSYLNSAHLLVMTSHIEGFPLVILEAFSAGLPVISTNVGGISEQISHGVNGFLFDDNDKDQLALLLYQIINNQSLRDEISINNRNKYLANFTLDIMINKYKNIFKL